MRALLYILTVFFLIFRYAPFAQATDRPGFGLPLDCTPGQDCFVVNYVDMGDVNDGLGIDPFCGNRAYDTDKGTDFGLIDMQAYERGVNVLAAADGTVQRLRNGEEDRKLETAADLEQVQEAGRECGNAVLIDHGNGVQTLYCHLKKNSLRVKLNDTVQKGEVIGQVGLSGMTEFPHVHFGITWEGAVMDPFTGQNSTQACGQMKQSLWDEDLDLTYEPVILAANGFTTKRPTLKEIEQSAASPQTLPKESDILAYWVSLYGVREGDRITLTLTAPNGQVFATRQITQDQTRAQQFYFTGRKLSAPLMEGPYTARAHLKRSLENGQILTRDISQTVGIK